MIKNEFNREHMVLIGAVAVFIASLMIANITASKLYSISLFDWTIAIPVGTSLFALTFLATDVVSEVWGSRYSYALAFFGFVMRIFSLFFLLFAVDVIPIDSWTNQEAYATILSGSSGILLAGIITYPISQFTDILIFHILKNKHKGKNLLWLRNIGSTFISQTVDSVVFVTIAFGAQLPMNIVISIIIGQIVIKWIVALLDTPFVYMVRNFAQKRKIFDFSG